MRDVTDRVRSMVISNQLVLSVKNDVLGGDPALNRRKNLHLVWRGGNETREESFAEDRLVNLVGGNKGFLKVISAAYGYDGIDLDAAQGSYALALQFGLLDEPLRSKAAKNLYELTVADDHHPMTGFWSSIELLLSLSSHGYNEEAARMLNQNTMPSWGYMADHSTTFWESFDANTRSLSLNHWTHSAVNEWLWRNVVGLNPDEQFPGYKTFLIHPRPTKEVSWCNASYDSIHGRIVINWRIEGDMFVLKTIVPANSTATVIIPTSTPDKVTESGKPINQSEGVRFVRIDLCEAVYKIGSGSYEFTSPLDLK